MTGVQTCALPISENDKRLKGFIWRESEQPKTKEDIFLKNSKTKENNKENQLFGRGENNSRQK